MKGQLADGLGRDHLEQVIRTCGEGFTMVHDEASGEEFEQLLLVQEVRDGDQIRGSAESLVGASFGGTLQERRQEAWRDDRLHVLDHLPLLGRLCELEQQQGSLEIRDVKFGVVQAVQDVGYVHQTRVLAPIVKLQDLRVFDRAQVVSVRARQDFSEDWRGFGEDPAADGELCRL